MGSGGWPIKLMKKYQYEHFGFVAMVIGLVLAPWIITLYYCPNALEVYNPSGIVTVMRYWYRMPGR